jgi:hypothetical protein
MTMSDQPNIQNKTESLPEGPVSRLIMHTEELTRIIREEISILEARRPAEIAPLQAEKARLSSVYEEEYDALKQNQSLLGEKDSPLRKRLREVTKIFNDELVRLGGIILRMKSVTEGMILAISEEVAKKRQQVRNYSPGAEVTVSSAAHPVPIALNEVI